MAEFLAGYKTYIAALLLFAGAVGAWVTHDEEKAFEFFALGLAVFGIRIAIKKLE